MKFFAEVFARLVFVTMMAACTMLIFEKKSYADDTQLADSDIVISKNAESVRIKNDGGHDIKTIRGHDKNKVIKSFNSSMKQAKLKGKITTCSSIFYFTAGGRDGDVFYGGICDYQKTIKSNSVALCIDEMVGHFKMIEIDRKTYKKTDLIRLIASNCVGG